MKYVNENSVESTKTVNSIDIPINFRYSLGLGSIVAVWFTTGPQFEWNIGSKNWVKKIIEDSVGEYENLTFKTKDATLSWNLGAGVRVLNHLEVGLGYNLDLSSVAKLPFKINKFGELSTRANAFTIQATYLF